MTKQELQTAFALPQFPVSAKYDAEWIRKNQMGPCALWLCEFLIEKIELKPGMRVLDLGCGKGLTSIFLAKEYGVTVFANDLWIKPTENFRRFQEAGFAEEIIPIHAEARQLPYAEEFFDAIISIDSYEYYGTDALYLDYVSKFLKHDGQIGIVVPGLTKEFDDTGAPDYFLLDMDWSLYSYHSPEWWARLWRFSQCIDVEVSDHMPNGYDVWRKWNSLLNYTDKTLESDKGNYLTFGRTVGRKIIKRW